jgi:hypothetical protein
VNTPHLFFFRALLYIRRRSKNFWPQNVVIAMNYYPDQKSAENEPAARASLWHRIRPAADDRHTSLLFWVTVLGLGCTAFLCAAYGASSVLAKKGSEKLLRVDLLLPKLKSIHGDRKAQSFPMSEPHPSELAQPKERQTSASAHPLPSVVDHPHGGTVLETPHVATPEPWMHLIPQVDMTPPPLLETCDEPVIFMHPCTSPRGDSPMIHNWKTLTMYSLLSAATMTFVSPPLAMADDPKPLEEVRKSLKAIADRLEKIENKKAPEVDHEALLKAIRAEIKKLDDGALAKINDKIEGVRTSVDGLKAEVGALKEEQFKQKLQLEQHKFLIDQLTKKLDAAPTSPTVDKSVQEKLKAIQDAIAKLGPTKVRDSMAAPNGSATTSNGRVMLVNHYSDDLLFIINGARYRVPAHASRLVETVTPGSVNIEVVADRWGIFNRQVTTLAAGELFTLTATPPR